MLRTSQLLVEFFRFLDARGIPYCVMGDTHELPAAIDSDVDIVVPQASLRQLPALMSDYCALHSLRLVQCLQHESNAFYFVVAFESEGTTQFLALDLCGDYLRRARKLLTARELLLNTVAATDHAGRPKGFNVCAPAFEFAYYLLKKIDKEQLSARHAAHLTWQWRADPVGALRMLERYWGRSFETRLLSRAAESGDWTTVAKLLPRMRSAMHRRVRVRPRALLAEFGRRWRRWREPTGLLIAALGPDGSGKSTAMLAADRRVRQAFRQTTVVHLRPGFLYRPERAPSRAPHAEKPRGRARSFFKLLFFAADYALGYVFSLRPLLVRSNGVLFDRYYDDLLVDPVRYRHRGSMRIASWLRFGVPRPDLWLLFDAPAEVLQARKQEVSAEESERQRRAYRELLQNQSNVTVIDASQPLEDVVAATAQAVLARCEARTRARLGLPAAERRSPLAARCLLFFCRHRVPVISKLMRVIFNADIYCRVPRDLYLPHPYGIVIHSQTRLGRRVTVMQQATIGGKNVGHNVAPIIGDDVYIGAGARILGAVNIGNGATVGANAVITRDVPAGVTVVGANRKLEAGERIPVEYAAENTVHDADVDAEADVEANEAAVVSIAGRTNHGVPPVAPAAMSAVRR